MSEEQTVIEDQAKSPADTYRRSTEEEPEVLLMGRMVAHDPGTKYARAIDAARYALSELGYRI